MYSQPDSDWLSGLNHEQEVRDRENEALEQVVPGVSPGALLEAMEDPAVFPEIARGDLYVQLARLRQLSASGRMSATAHMEYTKMLARMGKVEQPEKDVSPFATAPLISITFPGKGGTVSIGAGPAREEKDITPS